MCKLGKVLALFGHENPCEVHRLGAGAGGYVVPPLPVPSLPLQSSPPHTPQIKQNKDLLKKCSRLNVWTLCVGPHSESPVEALGLLMC